MPKFTLTVDIRATPKGGAVALEQNGVIACNGHLREGQAFRWGARISHWPWPFQPHATAAPSLWSKIVWAYPAATCVKIRPCAGAGRSHGPSSLQPHAAAAPSLWSRKVWASPAATFVKVRQSAGA